MLRIHRSNNVPFLLRDPANYCYATRDASEGLLLLCEVALGEMHECYKATHLAADTLPTGTQSTKGCGQTMPNPAGIEIKHNLLMIKDVLHLLRDFRTSVYG